MAAWNRITGKFLCRQLRRVRRRRAELFLRLFQPLPDDTVLDLGSEDGSEIASFYPYLEKVVIADVNEGPLHRGMKAYGFGGYVLLHPDEALPLDTASFDIVWCSSVIEHVTGIDSSVLPPWDAARYCQRAEQRQREFAEEIRRVGRGYWVQTPNRRFPIEAHSMLPGLQLLSPYAQYQASRALKHIWIKRWNQDFHLLDRDRLARFFPEARILGERFCGLVKSWTAVKVARDTRPSITSDTESAQPTQYTVVGR